ncbi:hypothetical protein BDZ89DRAFT_1128277 [Hymenopellis radicata]|nr:hypothetical protein BDZ89DRAFT_1128277 [Hymenopellis radicata]
MSLSAPSDIRMESHTQSIDDVPNELVYLILGNLELEDLIPLGCVSRRFNILAFTFYFSLVHGLPHFINHGRTPFSSHYAFDHTPYPVDNWLPLAGGTQRHPFCTLSALRLAILVRQPVSYISASFTTARFVEEADQLQKYLRTAPELISLDLTLPTVDMHSFVAEEAREEQYRTVCRVLEALQTIIPRATGFTWTVGGDIAIPVDAVPFTGAALTNLHSVSLRECPVLFSPPLKDWTIASLHQSRVHSLEIDGSILAPYYQAIRLRHLRNLTIYAYDTLAALFSLKFLSRHPSLRKVSFLSNISPTESCADGSNYQLEDNALPHVTELSAPMEYLILWLSNASVLSSVSAVDADSCLALTPAFAYSNTLARGQLSAGYELTRELLTLMSQRPTISTFLFPLCELRGGDIFPAHDISHIRVLHCIPEFQFEMTDEAAQEIIATLIGFTGAKKLVVNQNRSRHGGWNAHLVPKLREICPGISLQLDL